MAEFSANGGMTHAPSNDIECEVPQSMQASASAAEAQELRQFQSAVLKITITVITVASGGFLISPLGYLQHTAHKVLAVAYAVVMFASFTLGLVLLLLVVLRPRAAIGPAVTRRLMLAAVVMVHVGVGIGTYLALVEDA